MTTPDVTLWLTTKGWHPFPFQKKVWQAMAKGQSGLLHATTGAGKTLAVWLGALQALAHQEAPLTVLWITPMRALSHDTLLALQDAAAGLAPDWTLAARTGDTSSSERASQQRRWPTALVTTPESLSLMLSRADAPEVLRRVSTAPSAIMPRPSTRCRTSSAALSGTKLAAESSETSRP